MERIVDWPITSKTSCHVFIRSILSAYKHSPLINPPTLRRGIYQSDLAALYVILVEKILRERKFRSGKGYYFAIPSFFQAGALEK